MSGNLIATTTKSFDWLLESAAGFSFPSHLNLSLLFPSGLEIRRGERTDNQRFLVDDTSSMVLNSIVSNDLQWYFSCSCSCVWVLGVNCLFRTLTKKLASHPGLFVCFVFSAYYTIQTIIMLRRLESPLSFTSLLLRYVVSFISSLSGPKAARGLSAVQ